MKKIYKFKLDLVFLNAMSIVLFLACAIPILFTCKWFKINFNMNLIIIMILWMLLHELLHGIGFGIFKGVRHNNIKYGIALEKGIFYCMCRQVITKNNILTSLLFPFTFIGIITLIIGIILKSSTLVILSLMNIAGAVGDIAMFLSILMMPKNINYIDLDDIAGFYLISDSDLSKQKLIGFKFDSVNDWKDDVQMASRKKVTISKLSWFIILFLLIIAIIDNIL